MFSSPLLPQGFLIVDESGNSRGDFHHNIAGLLFSCLGSFFSSLFSSSHHEPISYRAIASYYPNPSSSYHLDPSSSHHPDSSSSYCPGPSPSYYPRPSSPYHPVSSTSHPVHLSHPSQPSSLSQKSEKSREELDRREKFPAVQARPSVQASSEKPTKLQKKSSVIRPGFLYSFFVDRQSMWFLLVYVVSRTHNCQSILKLGLSSPSGQTTQAGPRTHVSQTTRKF